jgi:hypothetical protein
VYAICTAGRLTKLGKDFGAHDSQSGSIAGSEDEIKKVYVRTPLVSGNVGEGIYAETFHHIEASSFRPSRSI